MNARILNRLTTTGLFCFVTLFAAQASLASDYFELVKHGKHMAVGRVVIKGVVNGQWKPMWSGTGTMIDKDIVLTAAHVVGDAVVPHVIFFEVTKEDGTIWETRAIAYRTHPEYLKWNELNPLEQSVIDMDKPSVHARDMSLLRLQEPCPIQFKYPELGELPAKGSPVEAVGFGQIEGPTASTPAKRAGKLEFLEKTANGAIFKAPTGKLQRTNHGDSGGPLLVQSDDKARIVAITIARGDFEKFQGLDITSYGIFASIEENRSWLDEARGELKAMKFAEAPYFYLIRRPNPNSGQLSLTRQQIAGLLDVDVPPQRVIGRVFARGVNEPIRQDVLESWVKRYNLQAGADFVAAEFSRPFFPKPTSSK